MMAMGLLVDAVFEVLDVEPAAIEAVPPLGMLVPPAFVAGMVNNARDAYAACSIWRTPWRPPSWHA